MSDTITLRSKAETINDITFDITIPKDKFNELCRKYGTHGFGWYFVGRKGDKRIKYFDDEKQSWNYTTL